MRKVVLNLWIGNARDARDCSKVLDMGIEAIVDLAYEEPPITATRELISLRIPLQDGAGNSVSRLRLAIHSVLLLLSSRRPTLLACSAGMSRSPAVAVAALSLYHQESFDKMLRLVTQEGACDIAPALILDVKKIVENELKDH